MTADSNRISPSTLRIGTLASGDISRNQSGGIGEVDISDLVFDFFISQGDGRTLHKWAGFETDKLDRHGGDPW